MIAALHFSCLPNHRHFLFFYVILLLWLCFFGLGFIVVPCLLITHQLAVWTHIVWFKHLLLFRRGRGVTHGCQGSFSRYQIPRSPAGPWQIPEEPRGVVNPRKPHVWGLRPVGWTQDTEERVWRGWGAGTSTWPHQQQDAGRQRDSFHQIKLANLLPCRTGIVIQTLCHRNVMIYHSSQPTQTDTRDLWAINW